MISKRPFLFQFCYKKKDLSYLVAVADRLPPDVLLGRMAAVIGDHHLIYTVRLLVPEPEAALVQVVEYGADFEETVLV